MDIALTIIFVGSLIFLAHLFTDIFKRTMISDVLLLILIGICIGPVLAIVSPEDFGSVGPVFTIVTLIVILFESGIGLNLGNLKRTLGSTVVLTFVNFIATMLVVSAFAFILTDLDPLNCFILGAILGGTSSAIVIPLIERLEMQEEPKTILLLESALSDVLCIVVTLSFLEVLNAGTVHVGLITGHMISSLLLAVLIGFSAAIFWSLILNKIRVLEDSIFTTLAFVFVVYGLAEELGYSGPIACLTFGITIGNIKSLTLPILKSRASMKPLALNNTEKVFFSEIVFLLRTFFFVYVGISMIFSERWGIVSGIILTLLIFIIRVIIISLSVSKYTSKKDASLMAVIVPKGLAAAVLASIPLQQGLVGGQLIQTMTFVVVFFSIVMTSLLIFLVDRTFLAKFYEFMLSDFGKIKKS